LSSLAACITSVTSRYNQISSVTTAHNFTIFASGCCVRICST